MVILKKKDRKIKLEEFWISLYVCFLFKMAMPPTAGCWRHCFNLFSFYEGSNMLVLGFLFCKGSTFEYSAFRFVKLLSYKYSALSQLHLIFQFFSDTGNASHQRRRRSPRILWYPADICPHSSRAGCRRLVPS